MKEVRDTKEEEGEIESKEEEEEGDGGAERANEQEEGENEPALIRSQSVVLKNLTVMYLPSSRNQRRRRIEYPRKR
jgi:hypothetical protein